MNTAVRFYKEGMSRGEIRDDFNRRRIEFGKRNGFDGLKILTPIQKSFPNLQEKTEEEKQILLEKYNSKYADGHFVRITQEMIDRYTDLYDLDIYSDILMIVKELPGIALAYPVADCPVLFVEDTKNQVAAMAHCGGEYIDRELPAQVVEAVRKETDAKREDLNVFVGPHAQKESFIYDKTPVWVRHFNIWSNAIVERRGY